MIKHIVFFIFVVQLFAGCVERFYLEDSESFQPKVVISALITDENENQQVVISHSSQPELSDFIPIRGCNVEVVDKRGNVFVFTESYNRPGTYTGIIEKEFFYQGNAFQIHCAVLGQYYESVFEDYMYCPPVDSIYYELESRLTSDKDINEDGAQFYLDFRAPDDYGTFYRFTLEETWEYHSSFEIDGYFDGSYVYTTDDYSLYYCYKTEPINEIFTLSTQGFKENTYIKYRLHFTNDRTQRLMHNYSILVKQYTMTEEAHDFWERLKDNQQESGSLFDKQPSQVKGNLYNVNNEKEEVLGYFGVSAVKQKRIVIPGIKELNYYYVPYCSPTLDEMPLYVTKPSVWPVYFVYFEYNGSMARGLAADNCFDCRLKHGVLEKPDFFE